MARPIHTGLDYFPFDGDFFRDIKIRKLIKYQGGKAALVYVDLLCRIYGGRGYYIVWDSELPFIISDDLGSGYDEGYVFEVIKTCVSVGLFHEASYNNDGVLTSKAIQMRYRKACETSKRKATISLFNLLEPELDIGETSVSSVETRVITEETRQKGEEMQQSKVKESKYTPPISNEIFPPLEVVVDDSARPSSKGIEDRKHDFGLSLIPFVDKYGKEMVREFFDYWTEHNDNGRKMRFEMEKIFNVSRRLATWKKNEDKFGGKKPVKRGSTISEAIGATAIPENELAGSLDITKLLK